MQELSNSQFLQLLRQHNIEIHATDERLQISAPAGAVDPQLRAELVRRKADLLAALRDADAHSSQISPVATERDKKIPQTYAQQGLWIIDHFEPGNATYNIPEAFLMNVPVCMEALQKAVDALLVRHESLRTYFYEEDGDLLQAVSPEARTQVGFTDLSALEETKRDPTLNTLIREHARRPFELHRPPLVRFHVFRLDKQRHVIFFNIHHIIADRRSLQILHEELDVLYQAAVSSETVRLPDLPIQYPDYALWSAKHMDSAAIEKQIQYWKKKLAGVPAFLELPCSRPYPAERTASGAIVPVTIPASLRDDLRKLGQEEGASLFMTLLAAFAVLLHRHSGSEDFCIGSPFTHRKQVETESIIGLFLNMLAFRCELAGNQSFRECLRVIRNTALDAYENSDVPFQKLVRTLKPDLRSRRSPLFQIMFGFDSTADPQSSKVVQGDTYLGTARYDLTLELGNGPNGILGSFEYCTDLFEETSIVQLAEQFLSVLNEVVRRPNGPISSISISSCARRKQDEIPDFPITKKSEGPIKKLARWLSLRTGRN